MKGWKRISVIFLSILVTLIKDYSKGQYCNQQIRCSLWFLVSIFILSSTEWETPIFFSEVTNTQVHMIQKNILFFFHYGNLASVFLSKYVACPQFFEETRKK